MTTDGVYKLIQRGKLAADRVSERRTVVFRSDLDEFISAQRARVARRRRPDQLGDPAELRRVFEDASGRSPEAWLEEWKANRLEDSPENMTLLIRALALRPVGDRAPLEETADAWAVAAFQEPRPR